MRTLGVDLAKEKTTTAMCTIRWEGGRAEVESIEVGVEDDGILIASVDPTVRAVALDAPFGWPRAMVAAVSSWQPGGRWASPEARSFRLRRTDEWVRAETSPPKFEPGVGIQPAIPLSVSADKIAMAAWRACRVLDALAQKGLEIETANLGTAFPDDGRGRVVEAYPAAALARWRIPRAGYKSEDGRRVREAMVARIETSGPSGWIVWSADVLATCAATDHALDAMLCALVARAAALGLVEGVSDGGRDDARAEGWIALPEPDALSQLATGTMMS